MSLRTNVPRIANAAGMPNSYGEMLDPAKVQLIMNMLDEHNEALDAAGIPLGTAAGQTAGAVETIVAAGALSPGVGTSFLEPTAAIAVTLAAPTTPGQQKRIEAATGCSATNAVTLTITNPATGEDGTEPSVHVFHSPGQAIVLEADSSLLWHHVAKVRGGHLAVVVGTTVLTGYDLAASYDLSVTGTVSSTTTKAIPAGCVPGEMLMFNTPTAASTPSGTIALLPGTVKGTGAAASTGIGGINATTCAGLFVWSDATNGWVEVSITTATYS